MPVYLEGLFFFSLLVLPCVIDLFIGIVIDFFLFYNNLYTRTCTQDVIEMIVGMKILIPRWL